MVKDHYIRRYTEIGGTHPFNWRIVGDGDLANAATKILKYFRDVKKQVPEPLRYLFNVNCEKGEFDLTYNFGASSVVVDDINLASLTVDGGSKKGLEILLKVMELDKFESSQKPSKKRVSQE